MSALAVAAAGLVAGLAVHIWHVVTTRRADIVHYDAVHRDATPTRQVVAEADRTYRLWHKACQDNARLRAFAYDLLFERLIGARPRPVVRLPARSHHRLGWRDRARWFRPWPLAAITEPPAMTGVCLLCGYATGDLDELDDHVDSHMREPDGTCPLCGAAVRQACKCCDVQAVPA